MHASSLHQARNLFIRRWGEMASGWGISRTMAEIHAALFITSQPLCTDDLMECLQASRGNISMNLRQLLNWGLIHRVHRQGDRKEYFVAEADIWQMFEIITRERRRREVEPIVETIERCRAMLAESKGGGGKAMQGELTTCDRRLADMQTFFTTMNGLFNVMLRVGAGGVGEIVRRLRGDGK